MAGQGTPKLDSASKNNWQRDKDVAACFGCKGAFSGMQAALLVRRRHHCRVCGRVFCADCTTNQVVLPAYGKAAQRACNACYAEFQDSTKVVKLEVGNSHTRVADDDEEAVRYQQQYMSSRLLGAAACHRCTIFVRPPTSGSDTLARNALTQVDFKWQSKGVRVTEPPWETDFSQLWTVEGWVYINLHTIDGNSIQLKHWVYFSRPVVFKTVQARLTLLNCSPAALAKAGLVQTASGGGGGKRASAGVHLLEANVLPGASRRAAQRQVRAHVPRDRTP
eukprot:SAG22_NODE_688_length_7907_cov_7.557505_7_plen_278_part_00